jgi:hypothetical protein
MKNPLLLLILGLFIFGAGISLVKGLLVGIAGYGLILLVFAVGVWLVYRKMTSSPSSTT